MKNSVTSSQKLKSSLMHKWINQNTVSYFKLIYTINTDKWKPTFKQNEVFLFFLRQTKIFRNVVTKTPNVWNWAQLFYLPTNFQNSKSFQLRETAAFCYMFFFMNFVPPKIFGFFTYWVIFLVILVLKILVFQERCTCKLKYFRVGFLPYCWK